MDVSKYTIVDQCLAAAKRVRIGQDGLHEKLVRADTAEQDEQAALRPLAAPVTQAAVRCAERFDPKTAKLSDFAYLMQLFLIASRDADAKTLLERRLAAVPAKSVHERVAVEDSAVRVYLAVQPRRLDPAEQLLVARARGGADRLERMELYYRLMDAARDAGDTTRARRAATWVLAVGDSLTEAERESDKFTKMGPQGGSIVLFSAVQQIVGVKTLVDSLRHSTMAMVNLERTMWSKFTKERAEALPLPIGEHAPQLAGDFWFPGSAAGEKHPSPGHVSIVQFVDVSPLNGGCINIDPIWRLVGDACAASFAMLRRLSEHFPGLEINLVMGTRGNFMYMPPPSPAAEAELYHKWIEPYQIRGVVLSVTTRSFWNLPSPDSRRIDKATPDAEAYTFAKSWAIDGFGGGRYLVDQEGIVVDVFFNEAATNKFIDALVHRQQAGGDRAEK